MFSPNGQTNRIQRYVKNSNIQAPIQRAPIQRAPIQKAPIQKAPIQKAVPAPNTKLNSILIVCDQLLNFKNIPENIMKILPGFQSFRRLGVEFTNIYNNRQDCSPSRGSFFSSQLDINIGDNIDFNFQYDSNPQLSTEFDTICKSLKRNGIDTAYYGKNHFVSKMATDAFVVPAFNTNSRGCLKDYGVDIYNTYGDTYYYSNEGIFADNTIFDLKVNSSLNEVDYIDQSGKYIGAIPYLKSRKTKKNPFHLEIHFENPHDTQHLWQNFALKPTKEQLQFWVPYLDEQINYINSVNNNNDAVNPYVYSDEFPNAYIQNPNLVKNYFENTFTKYISNYGSLPFLDSYIEDYVTDPTNNSIFPFFAGIMKALNTDTTTPTNSTDIMSWKNLINNYYALLLEVDLYIYKIFLFLKNNNMLKTTSVTIISDHGDLMSAHGMKQKGVHFDEGTNVACLVYSPFLSPNWMGKKCDVIGSLLDIAPTMDIISNIRTVNTNFLGTTLLQWQNNKLVPRNVNVPVFNVYYSWMTYLTYFEYKIWYKSQDTDIQQKVLTQFNPSNFYNYLAFYNMIVDDVNGKKYKLARYFNFQELLAYNFVFNPKLKSLNITTTTLINSISDVFKNTPLFSSDVQNLNTLLNGYFSNNSFNIQTMLTKIQTDHGNDSITSFIFLSSIINIVKQNVGFSLMVPGYYNNTYTMFNNFLEYFNDPDANYYFFMYNLTDDPHETINLLDKGEKFNRITNDTLALGTLLNNKLNLLIDKYKIVNFDFIIPNKVMESIALNIKLSDKGNDYHTYTDVQQKDLSSCYGLNKSDGDKNTKPYYNSVLSAISNITNI